MALIDDLRAAVTRIDAALDLAAPNELASLLRERRITLAEIDSLSGPEEGSIVDELTKRRKDRRSAAGIQPDTASGR
jgi:hypothetical protein